MRHAATVRASAPARVDLAGGTLDIWPLYLLLERAVTVNAAVTLRARAEVSSSGSAEHRVRSDSLGREVLVDAMGLVPAPRPGPLTFGELPLHEAILRHLAPERALSVETWSDVPPGSGLGGSSSLAVALIAAIRFHLGAEIDLSSVADTARDIEAQVIQAPTGTQDHLAAIHGGVAAIHFGVGAPRRERLEVDARSLESRGVLAFVGESRASSRANWDMVRRAMDNYPATRRGLSAIAAIAERMRKAILAADFDEAARLLGAEWSERRGLSPEVSTAATERSLAAARGAGAAGGKICGAGGGGCLFVMGPPDARDRIAGALREAGCRILEFAIDARGLLLEPAGEPG
jgi:D-glycero-alpha-D-manno-heptose-7-phosphate kinase